MSEKLTNEQEAALADFAAYHGRAWKRDLAQDWEAGRDNGPELQQVRNSLGPSWLAKYKRK